jgi:hypothetical protein
MSSDLVDVDTSAAGNSHRAKQNKTRQSNIQHGQKRKTMKLTPFPNLSLTALATPE